MERTVFTWRRCWSHACMARTATHARALIAAQHSTAGALLHAGRVLTRVSWACAVQGGRRCEARCSNLPRSPAEAEIARHQRIPRRPCLGSSPWLAPLPGPTPKQPRHHRGRLASGDTCMTRLKRGTSTIQARYKCGAGAARYGVWRLWQALSSRLGRHVHSSTCWQVRSGVINQV